MPCYLSHFGWTCSRESCLLGGFCSNCPLWRLTLLVSFCTFYDFSRVLSFNHESVMSVQVGWLNTDDKSDCRSLCYPQPHAFLNFSPFPLFRCIIPFLEKEITALVCLLIYMLAAWKQGENPSASVSLTAIISAFGHRRFLRGILRHILHVHEEGEYGIHIFQHVLN